MSRKFTEKTKYGLLILSIFSATNLYSQSASINWEQLRESEDILSLLFESGQQPVHGVIGVSGPDNEVGLRAGSTSWMDEEGNLWLFGGLSTTRTLDFNPSDFFNDLWRYDITSREWTWMNGADEHEVEATYGLAGEFGPTYSPGARIGSASWTDNNGTFWLFGGFGNGFNEDFADLWNYDPISNEWAFIKGVEENKFEASDASIYDGIRGTRGVPDSNNFPPSRSDAATWVDHDGKLWMYSGSLRKNDLWMFDPETTNWTWMGGSASGGGLEPDVDIEASYGELGVPSVQNFPTERFGASTWVDDSGDLWMFGGGLTFNVKNDLWRYDIETSIWTWENGSSISLSAGHYGELGVPDPLNQPPAREYASSWTDGSGCLWLYGGKVERSTIIPDELEGTLHDLWKYDIQSGMWTWEGGTDIRNNQGNYDLFNVETDYLMPSSRFDAMTFGSSGDSLYLFGGWGLYGSDTYVDPGKTLVDDLWKFNTETKNWTLIDGSITRYRDGSEYGEQQVFNSNNRPAAVYESATEVDSEGNLWFFGGFNQAFSVFGKNDLWKYDLEQDQWSWFKGFEYVNQMDRYGTQSVENSFNTPGGRYGMASWIDSNDQIYIFGGYRLSGPNFNVESESQMRSPQNQGTLNDLWRYNPSTNNWTWLKGSQESIGSQTSEPIGSYGERLIESETNNPGARLLAGSEVDDEGNLWLIGGNGRPYFDILNDIWKFDLATNNWTWIAGSEEEITTPVLGIRGVPSLTNIPAGFERPTTWLDQDENIWIFGGRVSGTGAGPANSTNLLWKYDIDNDIWIWMNGVSEGDFSGIYGPIGVEGESYTPGARTHSYSWVGEEGDLWLYGGYGLDENGENQNLTDLWKLNPKNGYWAWMGGVNEFKSPSSSNINSTKQQPETPIARTNYWVTFENKEPNIYIYGWQSLNDMWKGTVSIEQVDTKDQWIFF